MKRKYKLKKWVVTGIYVSLMVMVLSSAVVLNRLIKYASYSDETLSYVYRGILDDSVPVVKYKTDKIINPYESEKVEVSKNYYDKDSDEAIQEKSLILYQNTYMPNTGILYKSDEEFDVVSVLDGTVTDIVADEIMGNIVTVKHSNNLTTIYQSLNEVDVLIGDLIKQGDVIGSSGAKKIDSDSDYMLLFEVIIDGEYVNPDTFYNMKLEDLN